MANKMAVLSIMVVVVIVVAVMTQQASDIQQGVSCLIKRHSWLAPVNINITWSLPTSLTKMMAELKPNITWVTSYNTGTCSSQTSTSCVCYYGDVNCMYFDSVFIMRVLLVAQNDTVMFNTTWRLDAQHCEKPPSVDVVTIAPISSRCLHVRWSYDNTTCSTFTDKIYRLIYMGGKTATKMMIEYRLSSDETCSGARALCDLKPATKYTISVQCKTTDYLGRKTGHWSDPTVSMTTTLEDIPAGSPRVTAGSFAVAEDRSLEAGIRLINIYWKELKSDERNGKIIQYTVTAGPVIKVVDAESTSCNLWLTCNQSHDVTIRAATAIGNSTSSATLFIPRHTRTAGLLVDVIPEVDSSDVNILRLSWKLMDHHNASTLTSFWCLRDSLGQCKSAINWEIADPPLGSYDVNLTSGHPASAYMFGVSVDENAIVWTSCLFLKDGDITFSPNLRSGPTSTDRTILVLWDNPPCEERLAGPYIDLYVLYVRTPCPSKACGEEQQYQVDGRVHSFMLIDLDHGVYQIRLAIVGLRGDIRFVGSSIYVQPYNEPIFLSTSVIVLVSVCLFALFVIGAVFIFRKMRKCIKTTFFKRPEIAEIEISNLQPTPV